MRLDSSFQLVGLTYTFEKLCLEIFQKNAKYFPFLFFLGVLVARYKFPQRIDLTNGEHHDVLQCVLQHVGTIKMEFIDQILSNFNPRVHFS